MKSKDAINSSEILDKFRQQVFDLKQDDSTLLRFLKYTGYSTSTAEEMLRKSVKWRKENNVGSYLHWKPPKAVADDFKFQCVGLDNDGHSVIYLPIGGWQTKKMIEIGYKEESFQFRFHLLETIMDFVKKTNKDKFVMIMDMKGLTYKKCIHYETIQLLSLTFKDFEDNFPNKLRACYIINAPWAFTYIYNVLKHLFSTKTLNKAKVFNEDEDKWKSFLKDRIPIKLIDKIWDKRRISSCSESTVSLL